MFCKMSRCSGVDPIKKKKTTRLKITNSLIIYHFNCRSMLIKDHIIKEFGHDKIKFQL